MPILWRYLLGHYFKVLVLCILAFVAILLTTRLDEIANFATLGASSWLIFVYVLYQLPYIFPIALPISCLISAILLIQRLSSTHELTALRSSGIALRDILAPILLGAALLSLVNFYIISEIATQSHYATGVLKSELRSVNPLLLLNNARLMKLKGAYFNTLGTSRLGEFASQVIFAVPSKTNNHINVMIADNLQASSDHFLGTNITLLTALRDNKETALTENISEMSADISDFSRVLQEKAFFLNNDHLKLSMLLVRLQEQKNKKSQSDAQQIKQNINRSYSEIMRRASIGTSVFTFTLMGAAFGGSIGRQRSKKGIIYVMGLTSLYLIGFFSAKGFGHHLLASALLYFLPLTLIIFLSIRSINRMSQGIEK